VGQHQRPLGWTSADGTDWRERPLPGPADRLAGLAAAHRTALWLRPPAIVGSQP